MEITLLTKPEMLEFIDAQIAMPRKFLEDVETLHIPIQGDGFRATIRNLDALKARVLAEKDTSQYGVFYTRAEIDDILTAPQQFDIRIENK